MSIRNKNQPSGSTPYALRILATTDVHLHIYPYDYYADQGIDSVGLARTARLIAQLKSEVRNSLVVDNGDFLQGNPLGDFIAFEEGLDGASPHPAIGAMNAVGYDAVAIGNHEFNYGIGFLRRTLSWADFPVLCANVSTSPLPDISADRLFLPPYLLIERQLTGEDGSVADITIGILGLCPPQILLWDERNLKGRVWVHDMVEATEHFVREMREKGADIVLALAHTGISGAERVAGMENAGLYVAGVEGVDAVICGHQHQMFPGSSFRPAPGIDPVAGTLAGKPAVMPGFWGSHAGCIDLDLVCETGTWRVVGSNSSLHPIARWDGERAQPLVDSAPEVLRGAHEAHKATLDYIRKPVGQTRTPIHSYFAMIGNDPAVQVINDAQRWYARSLLDGSEWAGLPLISAASPFKAGGRSGPFYYSDVPAGLLTIKSIADLYLYPNLFAAVLVDGAMLTNWIERSATIFRQVPVGSEDIDLIAPELPSYEFDVIDGVSYEIDISEPARFSVSGALIRPDAARVKKLCFEGRDVRGDDRFVLATNNYRVGGGGHFLPPGSAKVLFDGPDTSRDLLMDYIRSVGTLSPAADWNWRLAPLPGTSVVYETGAGAGAYEAETGPTDLVPLGGVENGVRRYRLTLS